MLLGLQAFPFPSPPPPSRTLIIYDRTAQKFIFIVCLKSFQLQPQLIFFKTDLKKPVKAYKT